MEGCRSIECTTMNERKVFMRKMWNNFFFFWGPSRKFQLDIVIVLLMGNRMCGPATRSMEDIIDAEIQRQLKDEGERKLFESKVLFLGLRARVLFCFEESVFQRIPHRFGLCWQVHYAQISFGRGAASFGQTGQRCRFAISYGFFL